MTSRAATTHSLLQLISSRISIFNQTDPPKQCNDHHNCPSLLRLATTLTYYSYINNSNKAWFRYNFTRFITQVHTNLIDDYIHFINQHGHQIEDIHEDFVNNYGFNNCNIKTCTFTSRHHGLASNLYDVDNDRVFEFYKSTMDSLHFYIFHIFEAGLRTKSNPAQNNGANRSESDHAHFVDREFDAIRAISSATNKTTKSFQRFGCKNNSKFTIKAGQNGSSSNAGSPSVIDVGNFVQIKLNHTLMYTMNEDYYREEENVETYLDSLYSHLMRQRVKESVIYRFKAFIAEEQYDTDGVVNDVMAHAGNVEQSIDKREAFLIMARFLQSSNCELFDIF